MLQLKITGISILTGFTGRLISLFFFLTFWVGQLEAQPCNCDHTITLQQYAVNGVNMGVQPGDTVCIEAGARNYLYLSNFTGDSLHYIVFINCGGAVNVQNSTTYGIKFANSRYFRVTGSGDGSIQYGIKVLGTGPSSNGLSLDEKSSNFEVDHFEIANTGFAGIVSKTDPKCDLSTNRGHFIQYQTIFHDNYIHNTGGEGFYIGHSFYSGYQTTCGGLPDTLYPHEIKVVRVYNNIVENSHWDGIQVGCAVENCEIYGNKVTGYGLDQVTSQNAGIQVGGGTTGLCYNNLISDGSGTGINVFGIGNNLIFNNVIRNAGLNYFPGDPTKRVHGIFCDDRETFQGRYFSFVNNTIVHVKTDGIRFSSLQSTGNQIVNNVIVRPGSLGSYATQAQSYINILEGASVTQSDNYTAAFMVELLFRDTVTGNLRLLAGSPAKDAGENVSAMGVTFDKDDLPRPYSVGFDIGAYEYHPENEWTGSVSSSWAEPGNWSKESVPNGDDDIILIPGTAFQLVLNETGKVCHHFVVRSGAVCTLGPDAEITILGNMTIEAGAEIDNQGIVVLKGNIINQNP